MKTRRVSIESQACRGAFQGQGSGLLDSWRKPFGSGAVAMKPRRVSDVVRPEGFSPSIRLPRRFPGTRRQLAQVSQKPFGSGEAKMAGYLQELGLG